MTENHKILKVKEWKQIQDFYYETILTTEMIENAFKVSNMIAGKTTIIVKARRQR